MTRDEGVRHPAPSAAVLVDGDRSWTDPEVDRAIRAWGGALSGAGVEVGARVAVLLPGGEGILAIRGVLSSGRVGVPLNHRLKPAEVRRALDALEVSALVLDEAADPPGPEWVRGGVDGLFDGRVPGLVPGSGPALWTHGSRSAGDPVAGVPPPRPEGEATRAPDERSTSRDRSRPFAVLWTSGSEGRPRGVELTRGNVDTLLDASADRLELGPRDRWGTTLSPGHVGGLMLVLRAARTGARLVVVDGGDSEAMARRLLDGTLTHVAVVPTQLARILRAWGHAPVPPTMRLVLVGGAAPPADLLESALERGVPVASTYGMTEASSQVATATPAEVLAAPGSVGRPLAPVEIRIGEGDEIQVRGPTVAHLYVGDGAPRPVAHPDGWYRTGDVGRLDAAGRLWVTGRRSTRIITGGVNVDPTAVEETLRRHGAVRDVVVLGRPDPEWGERVVAVVVPEPGAVLDPSSLRGWARGRMSGARVPKEIHPIDALPLNANGKVDRSALRRWLEGRSADG